MLRLLPDSPAGAAENLALDAALFRRLEDGSGMESLRIWESPESVVVLGRSGVIERDIVDGAGVAVLHRESGGAAVMLGPGCIAYSLVLSLEERPELRDVRASYRAILGCVVRALTVAGLETRGSSDLAIAERKVSGNAQRRGQRALLHHGTLLYRFNPAWMSILKHPGREPDYRRGRSHDEFIANLPLDGVEIRHRLARLPALLTHPGS
jgi:lipoate-protein ligase A